MLTQHIALVPEADGVNPSELARVSSALQKQVLRDVSPLWGIAATVDAFPRLEDVPVGYFPIIVSLCELGPEAGVYLDGNGHPYAQIELWASWSLDASRACIEMLVNPFGNRSVTGASPRSDQGPVEFLVEACAPCGGPLYAYAVNDVIVSDFCTPAFFGCGGSAQTERCSFAGSVELPFEVLPGGHLSWYDPVSDAWWRRSHFGDAPIDTRLDQSTRSIASVREITHGDASSASDRLSLSSFEARLGVTRKHSLLASQIRAQRLRALLGQGLDAEILSYGSVPPSRGARNHSSSQRDERLLRSAVSATPPAPPKRDETRAAAAQRPESPGQRESDYAEEPSVEVAAAEATPAASTAPSQPTTSRPPPLPTSSPAPAPTPVAAPAPYITGYPQMPAMMFTTPPPPPQQRSGARDTAFLLGGALVAAALIALLWSAREAVSSATSPAQANAPLLNTNAPRVDSTPVAAPPAALATENARPEVRVPSTLPPASTSLAAAPTASVTRSASTDDQGDRTSSSHHHREAEKPSRAYVEQTASKSAGAAAPASPLVLDELLDTRR